jgi:hypothetical protein
MLIRGIRMRKIGAAGRSYSCSVPNGSAVKIAVQEHGYEL